VHVWSLLCISESIFLNTKLQNAPKAQTQSASKPLLSSSPDNVVVWIGSPIYRICPLQLVKDSVAQQ
jgi:hypothetical protein